MLPFSFLRGRGMTIDEVLTEVDELKPNQYDDAMKVKWLSELDGKVFNELILTHVTDYEYDEFNGYTLGDMATELIAKEPYSDIYRNYVFAMIDYLNGETDRYINSLTMFNASMKDYRDWFNRTHTPKFAPLQLF